MGLFEKQRNSTFNSLTEDLSKKDADYYYDIFEYFSNVNSSGLTLVESLPALHVISRSGVSIHANKLIKYTIEAFKNMDANMKYTIKSDDQQANAMSLMTRDILIMCGDNVAAQLIQVEVDKELQKIEDFKSTFDDISI